MSLSTLTFSTSNLLEGTESDFFIDITQVVKSSSGWRELRIEIYGSRILSYIVKLGDGFTENRVGKMPISWDNLIRERDGKHSGAGCRVYKGSKGGLLVPSESTWEEVI